MICVYFCLTCNSGSRVNAWLNAWKASWSWPISSNKAPYYQIIKQRSFYDKVATARPGKKWKTLKYALKGQGVLSGNA